MHLLTTLWTDIQKIFAFAPVVAAIDPNAAGGISTAEAAIAALQPTIAAVQNAAGGTLTHADLVTSVTKAVADSSASLVNQGLVSSATADHLAALDGVVHAAVAVSGLAAK